jgi:peptide/nickel transport system substrate-binding protein
VPGDKIRLRKNSNYFRADESLPRFDQLEFRFVGEDDEKSLESIRSGECDFLDQKASPYPETIETSDFITYEAEQQIDLHYSPAAVWEHLDFNLAHADYDDGYQEVSDWPDFFGDQRTRHAIAMCIDWERMGSKLPALQLAERLASYVPTGHPLFNPETPRYKYDPQSAQALLEEAG